MLGDKIQEALTLVSITPTNIQRWLGRPCRCEEYKLKLNQLDIWARRVIAGRVDKAKEFLESILKG